MKPIEDKTTNVKKRKFIKKEYVLVIVLLVAVVVIFFSGNVSGLGLFQSDNEVESDYATGIENKLIKLLSDVDGVGKVNVFVSVEGSSTEIVLKEIEEKYEQGVKTTSESIVLVGGKPYVTNMENPKICGIAVVCEGADDLNVKVKITEILTTTLKIDADCVRIIKMK